MSLLQLVVIALVQGVTEFLPISSSGHLVLVPVLTDWPDQGLIIDVAVHVGTLGAVMLYFAGDIGRMISGVFRFLGGRRNADALLAALIVVGTLPVIGAGYAMNHYMPDGIRGVEVIAWATVGFGIVLYLADHLGMTIRRVEHLRFVDTIIIGIAQVLALIPGTSRSGITMVAARLLGVERSEAARFSMLLGIPAILGAGTLKGLELFQSGNATLTGEALTVAAIAFGAALVTIALLMAWLKRASFTPFVVYRILLGCGLLAWIYLP